MFNIKSKLIKELKQMGIRDGDKNGVFVPLEHLKTFQVVNLYYKNKYK